MYLFGELIESLFTIHDNIIYLQNTDISDTILQSFQLEFYYIVLAENFKCHNASWDWKIGHDLCRSCDYLSSWVVRFH